MFAWKVRRLVPPDHLFLDRSPNIGPLISRWELDKFKNCWNKSFSTSKILATLYHQFSNLLISKRDMSGPRLGALSNNRWSEEQWLQLQAGRPSRIFGDKKLKVLSIRLFQQPNWCHRKWRTRESCNEVDNIGFGVVYNEWTETCLVGKFDTFPQGSLSPLEHKLEVAGSSTIIIWNQRFCYTLHGYNSGSAGL